ncbi:heme exporter protein CcmB [Pseudomonas aeruginosa]|nr:heme exporter protein CcmB [Pseudomonas aeruginosa]MCY0405711.1 heme exporter protein CcmB [Pseudomonas aeruginosa]
MLSLLGAVGAALTVGLKRGGLLLALLILPPGTARPPMPSAGGLTRLR